MGELPNLQGGAKLPDLLTYAALNNRGLAAAFNGWKAALERVPQVIKSEDTFLTAYVLFDKKPGHAEVDVVEQSQRYLQDKINTGELVLPPGVSYTFAGTYETQVRSAKTLAVVLPLAMFVIFLILYFQFRSVPTMLLVFSGIFVAWAGGFILIWLYGQDWFLNFSVFSVNMRELFQVHTIDLSVAVWVGFLALFGGMLVVLMSIFVVPVLYCWMKELKFRPAPPREGGNAG